LSYRGVKLSFLIDRQKGGMVSNLTQWLFDSDHNSKDYDAAAPDGSGRPLGQVRVLQFASGNRYSKIYVHDASYLKLRELTLSFDFPSSLTRKMWSGARYVRASLSGRNLLIFTPYKGLDTEARWVAEQNSSQRLGQELWAYPPSRTMWFSLDDRGNVNTVSIEATDGRDRLRLNWDRR